MDVYIRPTNDSFSVVNDAAGIAELVAKISRVLTKGRHKFSGVSSVVGGVLQVVQQAQRQADHGAAVRDDLGPAAEAGKIVPDVAVVLLDGEGQVLAGEQLPGRDYPVIALPVVSDERLASSDIPNPHQQKPEECQMPEPTSS